MARSWRHSKMAMSSLALLYFMLGVDQPSASKFCKDRFVTYSSDGPYSDRVAADRARMAQRTYWSRIAAAARFSAPRPDAVQAQ